MVLPRSPKGRRSSTRCSRLNTQKGGFGFREVWHGPLKVRARIPRTERVGVGMHRRLDRWTYHPDTKRNPLDLIACEYGPTAPGALSVLMISLDDAKVRAA